MGSLPVESGQSLSLCADGWDAVQAGAATACRSRIPVNRSTWMRTEMACRQARTVMMPTPRSVRARRSSVMASMMTAMATDEGVMSTFHVDADDGFGPGAACRGATRPRTGRTRPTEMMETPRFIRKRMRSATRSMMTAMGTWMKTTARCTRMRMAMVGAMRRDLGCPEPGWVEQRAIAMTLTIMNPGMPSDMCDGVDSDCDGAVDEDSKAGWSLLSVNTGVGDIFEIDTSTAALTSISSVSTDIRINSMDVSENMTAVVHIARAKQIALLDACTGTTSVIGTHGAGGIGGIAFGPSGRLFGIGGESDALWEFDLGTGVGTRIGPLGIDIGSNGLAWDCTTQTMYGADTEGDRIFEIDLTTGAALN